MSNRGLEHCFLCDSKFKLENEKSVENHNFQHKEELERIKFSNNMRDAVKTICKLCMCPLPMSRMREHTKRVHNVHISEYKSKYGIASDRGYELVEKIFHRCGICNHPFPLDSDLVAGHIRKHSITHANYNAKYMVIKTNDPERNHSKQKSKAVKSPPIKIETKPSPTEADKSGNKKDETQGGMMRFNESKAMSESPKTLTAEKLFSHKIADQDKTSLATSKSPDPVMSDKEEAKPALSYAEQISMFLRGKQIKNTSFRESTEEKINSPSDISDRSTPLETKSSEDSPELKPNKVLPSLKPSENIANTDTLSDKSHQDQKSTHEPTLFPIPPKTAATELPPLKTSMCHSTNNNNNSPKTVESLKTSNLVPEDKCDSEVSSNKIGSGRKNIIRVLTPQSINEKYETEKTVSTSPIKPSRSLNILHQNPIKKVKLKNGKVLHIFINKNSKISKQPTIEKVEQNADKAASEALNLHDGVEDPIILKGTEGNLGDPLHVDKDTPALQVPAPDEMDVDDEKPHDQSVDKDFEVKDKMAPESSISEEVTYQMDIETELIEKAKDLDTSDDIFDTLSDNADSSDNELPINEELEKLNHKAEERCIETSEAITAKGDPDTDTGGDKREGYGTDTEKCIFEAESGEGEVETDMIVDSSPTTEVGCTNPEEEIKEAEEDIIHLSKKSETPDISSINNEEGGVALAPEQDSFIEGNVSKDGDTYEISTPLKTPYSTHDDSGFSDVELSDVSSVSVSSDLSPVKHNDFEKSTTELISRLATKTKEMLLPQISKSPVKNENGHGSVETIEKSEEFTQMMRRITDNMAALNGEEATVSASSWNTRNEEFESNGEGMGGGLLSENELDLVVEDIWSENFS